jgi:protoporphyrin/coproporphyrin ferrochelatase
VKLSAGLAGVLAQRMLAPLQVEVGMLYSAPDISAALGRLRAGGAQRLLVLPLFPQYCGATSGAAFDQVSATLQRTRWLPDLQLVADYHDNPGYIEALRASVTAHWEAHGRTPHLLISFHGIPERYGRQGDPYHSRCHVTARLLADELLLREGEWSVSFQSRFGPAQWLKPYTQAVLSGMPARGVREVTVVCPGFAVDCLETLEEIAIENRALFMQAGGQRFEYVSALNDSATHAHCLAGLIAQRCQGWTEGLREHLPGTAHGAPA